MKKSLLMACALLALTVGMASAAGLNLSWIDCNTSGQQNATFACAANTGINQLVGSYFPPGGITALTSNDGIVDLQTAGAVLSDWWRFDACRATALSMDANFLANVNCADYWQNLASLGFAAFYPRTLPNTERIKLSVALPDGSPAIGPVDPLVEYYSFRFTMTHAKSVGTGACAGCADAACIVLNELDLNQQPPALSYQVTNPAQRNYVTWQGGAIDAPGCPAATPTQNKTWGSVKALYR